MAAPAKELLKISELAEAAGVPVATVRHYLREGLLPEPIKTSRNMAYYPPDFVERIRLIKRLQEDRFMPLRVIREAIDSAGGDISRLAAVAEAGESLINKALASENERTSEEDVLERFQIPKRALRNLTELGVLGPVEEGYSAGDLRVIEAIMRFRAKGWNETTGFGARDVARLMKGLAPVIDDELSLMLERFTALDPERAAEILDGGMEPFPDLIGALHARALTVELERQRARMAPDRDV